MQLALKHPQEILQELTIMQRQIEQNKAVIRRDETWGGVVRVFEDILKIRDTEATIVQLRARIVRVSARLNYTRKVIADEMMHFQLRHANELGIVLKMYASAQIEAERAKLAGIEAVVERTKSV